MDPVSAIAIGATVAGGATSAFGSLMGGAAQAGMYKYQAGIAQMNNQIAQQNANYALQKGEVEAEESGMKTAQTVGQIKADQGASGLDVNRGSTVNVRNSQQMAGDFDQAMLRANAAKAAYGYRVGGLMDTAQSTIDQFAAKNAQSAGYISAAGTLLSTAGSVSSKWLAGRQAGLPGFGSGDGGTMTDDQITY